MPLAFRAAANVCFLLLWPAHTSPSISSLFCLKILLLVLLILVVLFLHLLQTALSHLSPRRRYNVADLLGGHWFSTVETGLCPPGQRPGQQQQQQADGRVGGRGGGGGEEGGGGGGGGGDAALLSSDAAPAAAACTWRVAQVVKKVSRNCHVSARSLQPPGYFLPLVVPASAFHHSISFHRKNRCGMGGARLPSRPLHHSNQALARSGGLGTAAA